MFSEEVALSKHAQGALAKRQISREWLDRVLDAPEWIEADRVTPELEHRLGRVPEFGDRVLRVIVNRSIQPNTVVTLFFDRRRNQL